MKFPGIPLRDRGLQFKLTMVMLILFACSIGSVYIPYIFGRDVLKRDLENSFLELSSVVERAVVLAEGGEIGPGELPLELREGADAVAARAFDLPPQGIEFEKVEEHLLRQAAGRSGGFTPGVPSCSG
ncbi:hypothetical protein K0B90_12405 [bacterium]|nr:hypothetical protein [bacterium]